jgi:uncharacterized protein (UPF0332 family)
LAAGRFCNAVNRAYYAAFQMSIAARIAEGEPTDNRQGQWRHAPTFLSLDAKLMRWGQPALTGLLNILYNLRVRADYSQDSISNTEAERALETARHLIAAVEAAVAFRR